METAVLLFKEYSGHGMIVTLFLLALCYLWYVEKNKENRRIMVAFPICVLVVFFCPLVIIILENLSEEDVFWRMLWSIPMLCVIAYASIIFIRKLEGLKRYLSIVGILAIIVISGDYLYNNPNYHKAENLENIPSEVIEICEQVIVDGREVMACFPSEMLMYVTQYTDYVKMPYGREVFLKPDGINMGNFLYDLVESEKVEAKVLSDELRNWSCHFVVLRKSTVLNGDLEKENWKKYYESEKYVVYLDATNDPRYW